MLVDANYFLFPSKFGVALLSFLVCEKYCGFLSPWLAGMIFLQLFNWFNLFSSEKWLDTVRTGQKWPLNSDILFSSQDHPWISKYNIVILILTKERLWYILVVNIRYYIIFSPPVNPPKEIEDPNDKKPEDWDEREK